MNESRRLGLALAAAAFLAASCSKSKGRLPDLKLPTLAGKAGSSLATCPTAKCVTVYVAPWCGVCRRHGPLLLALRPFLKEKGVETRFIVGQDKDDAVRAYARDFGPDTLLDGQGWVQARGVPRFFVTDQTGAILNAVSGVPGFVRNEKAMAWYLGVP